MPKFRPKPPSPVLKDGREDRKRRLMLEIKRRMKERAKRERREETTK